MIGGESQRVRIAMVGGGSGGHITPLLAVARELKQMRSDIVIEYVGQKGDSLGDIPVKDPNIDAVHAVRAGKLRRYHGEGLRQLLDLKTTLLNLRDVIYVLIGFFQSLALLRRMRPDVVFVKGGFVGVPVGLAAALLRIPYVTHDSDAIPGLANRIIARWAAIHAVALPAEVYSYPSARTISVGVPVSHEFMPRDERAIESLRSEMHIAPEHRVLLVTGGGLGAQRLNDAMVRVTPDLLSLYPTLGIIHLAGRGLFNQVEDQYDRILTPDLRERVEVFAFTSELYKFSAVADVVVTRAGGNSMAEFAVQGKACVVVPNPLLAGGHQSKNAQVLADRQAAVLVQERDLEDSPKAMLQPIRSLLDDPVLAGQMSASLQSIGKPDAAYRLAMVLLEQSPQTKTTSQDHEHVQQKET